MPTTAEPVPAHRFVACSMPTCPLSAHDRTCVRGRGDPFRDSDISRDPAASGA